MRKILYFLNIILLCFTSNMVLFLPFLPPVFIAVFILAYIFALIFPLMYIEKMPYKRLRVCAYGSTLLKMFLSCFVFSVIVHIVFGIRMLPNEWPMWLISALCCILMEAILFWIGIICVYLTSTQLGIRQRALGAICGFIPIANLIVLAKIIKLTSGEVKTEKGKSELNAFRSAEKICATKYPILLVHGVFFRDSAKLNYWGRIPGELEKNGATIFYGNQQSAASVAESAAELAKRIKDVLKDSGVEKLNIIAHSKGGLDIRYACAKLGADTDIASITTINTPHRGCEFADHLLKEIPKSAQDTIANTYNAAMRKLGDNDPDFMAAVTDLTASKCIPFDTENPAPEGIYCQSVGSKLNKLTSGKFPLNFSYQLVKHFDGANDGLVSEKSFSWGDKFTFITVQGKRGVSHADMIDLNRENIPDFDVREFYVGLVSDLKKRGM